MLMEPVNAHARVGGAARAGIVFLAGEDYKNIELFEMHTSLGPCGQMLLRHK